MKRSAVFLLSLLVFSILAGSLSAKELRILKPDRRGAAYDIAAAEFQKYYEQVCGKKLEITTQFNDEDDYIIIGGDMVNRFVRKLVEDKVLSDFSIGIDSDQYRLLSISNKGRDYLLLAGGRGRSTLYAVYEFFELRCGCRWFWDGDVVPQKDAIDLSGLDLTIKPKFEYRGIRYFAHRGLHRFQAEHWSMNDWKKEIDWCVKKRLNLIMLRIGQDDLFQKAFPDVVSYPDPSKPQAGMGPGYGNRNLFWSLQYRGKLRKQIMDYAFDRELMHPEDFGTMTHWYSPTPQEFLDKVQPEFTPQVSGYGLKTEQVWDIRYDRNLDNYWKITKASIDHYGKPEIFHTIGFAERMVYKNREDNFKMKVYFYRRMLEKVRAEYPNAPILLAGWDFYGWWTEEELQKLFEQLNPKNTIILDYTMDLIGDGMTKFGRDLSQMGIIGKFPYIAGLFLAYESALDIRGRYEYFQKNQEKIFNDSFCKGLVLWPESSHTDIFMLNYFTENAWKPGKAAPDELLREFCRDRYGKQADAFYTIWKEIIPPSQILSAAWNFWTALVRSKTPWDATAAWKTEYIQKAKVLKETPIVFDQLKRQKWPNEFIRRDSFDLARTLADRFLILGRSRVLYDMNLWREGKLDKSEAQKSIDAFVQMAEAMKDLLAMHDDYSMNATLNRMNAVEPIRNPEFSKVLIDNASNGYCMSHQYELMAYWYLPAIRFMGQWAKDSLDANRKGGFVKAKDLVKKESGVLLQKVKETPLSEMAPKTPRDHRSFENVMDRMAQAAKTLVRE